MGDNGFQIVQKNDGQFEIVQLLPVPVKKKTNSKLKSVDDLVKKEKSNQNPRGIYPILLNKVNSSVNIKQEPELNITDTSYPDPSYPVTKEMKQTTQMRTADGTLLYEIRKKPAPPQPKIVRPPALKNYSRTRKNGIKPTLIQLNKRKTLPNVKEEPELDIAFVDPLAEKMQDNEEEKLVVTGQHVSSGKKSLKIVKRVKKAKILNSNPELNTSSNPSRPLLSDLAKNNIKCNICNMTFPANSDQVKTLRVHFLQHKASVVLRKNDGVTYRTDNLEEETGSPNQKPKSRRLPIILNNLLRNKHQASIEPVVTQVVPAEKKRRSGTELEFPSKLPKILRQRKQVHVKPMPDALLDQFRSSTSQSEREPVNSHVVVGSTLIKPLKQQVRVVQSVDGIPQQLNVAAVPDEDDDIEIVEEVPELIVIDDNDELGGSK